MNPVLHFLDDLSHLEDRSGKAYNVHEKNDAQLFHRKISGDIIG
jgi:hypothetical protein